MGYFTTKPLVISMGFFFNSEAQLTYVLGKGLNLESYFRDGIGTLNPILGEVFGFLG